MISALLASVSRRGSLNKTTDPPLAVAPRVSRDGRRYQHLKVGTQAKKLVGAETVTGHKRPEGPIK